MGSRRVETTGSGNSRRRYLLDKNTRYILGQIARHSPPPPVVPEEEPQVVIPAAHCGICGEHIEITESCWTNNRAISSRHKRALTYCEECAKEVDLTGFTRRLR